MKKHTIKRLALLLALALTVGLLGGFADAAPQATAAAPAQVTPTTLGTAQTTEVTAAARSEKMETPIHLLNIQRFASTNANTVTRPIKGIVLDFHGLNGGVDMGDNNSELAQICAAVGILCVTPYDNPWSWMNDLTVQYVDEIVDAIIDKYDLPEDVPIVAAGGSMGGLSSLIYTRYAKRTPVACAANSPVTDLVYHYSERPDLPRTIYQAYMHYEGNVFDAIATGSPYHQAADMPDIPYLIVHGDKDTAVNKTKHSDKFVAELKKTHDDVTYLEVPGMGHCDLQGQTKLRYYNFITQAILSADKEGATA